jgi:hypothetical protein
MDSLELQDILSAHQEWCEGSSGTRANLERANLYGANLEGANLKRANLDGANLDGANLEGANLAGANLKGANLFRANLERANLYGANLDGANLDGANLYGANLYGANLKRARAFRANLDAGTVLPAFQLPAGELVVFKRLTTALATLRIEAHTPRTATLVGRKCRAASVFVLGISFGTESTAMHDGTVYRVNETVVADSYDDNPLIECTHGIHFFLTREEAEAY